MKIFITGATGFIGRAVLEELGHNPDLLRSGFSIVTLSKDGDMGPAGLGARHMRGDVCDINENIVQELRDTDVVIHLAASVHDARITDKEHLRVNYEATRDLFNTFIEISTSPIKQFIFVSTVSVFGNYKNSEYSENDKCSPDTSYGKSKLLAEEFIKMSKGEGETNYKYTILRPVTVFGPGDKGNVGKMIDFIKTVHFFPMFNPRAKKSFIYVKDVARAIVTCINKKEAFNETFILGTTPVTMHEMLDCIRSAIGLKFIAPKVKVSSRFSVVKKLSQNNIYSLGKAADRLNFIARDFKSGLYDMVYRGQ